MNLSEEQLSEIENMAALFFSTEDIAINVGLTGEDAEYFNVAVEFKSVEPCSMAYYRGRLTAEIELRKSIKQSALNGSTPAQTAMLNFERESRK